MIKALKDIFSFLLGLIILGLVVAIGILIFQTGPYSFYFVGIALIYILTNLLFKNKIKKLLGGECEDENKVKLYVIYFIRNIFRLFLFALIPIIILQIILDKPSFFGVQKYVETIENWYITIAQLDTQYHLTEIFIVIIIFTLLIAPILFYKTSKGKYAISSLLKALFVLNIILFIASFSFYTAMISQVNEQQWRFDKREKMIDTEKYLRKEIKDYYILSQIELSPSIQNTTIKIITAIISASIVDEVRIQTYDKIWKDKVSVEDEIKLEVFKILNTELELYKTESIDDLFKKNYNPNHVLKRLKILKEEESKFSDLRRAKLETLSNSISLSLGNILPNADNSIIKQIVDESLDKAMDFNIKFFLRDEKLKIPILILATRLNILEPNKVIINNEEFVTKYEKSLQEMKDTDIENTSKQNEKNYFDIRLHESPYKSTYEYDRPVSSEFEWKDFFKHIKR